MIGLELVAVVQQVPAPSALLEEGRQARLAGRFAEATVALEAAQRLRPDEPDILLELGLTYYVTERFADAERVLAHAQALAPQYRDVILARARVALARGRTGEARRLAGPLADQGDAEARAIVTQATEAGRGRLERQAAVGKAPVAGQVQPVEPHHPSSPAERLDRMRGAPRASKS